MSSDKIVRIGGASGFWGDSATGATQLAAVQGLDYISFDYLAELTMSILAGARARNPERGYATDFVDVACRQILKTCVQNGVKLVSNAGGINPHACAAALAALAEELGVTVRIAVVDGDDVMAQAEALRAQGVTDFYSGAPMPARLISANAYLGALPLRAALDAGADVVITGRVVDSALVLGVLMHEFDWRADDYDRLAAGSLAGHIIECGCQATGGLHTDWDRVPGWADMGYPIIECHADGSFVVTKPEGTGGLVIAPAVAEQMLYEIGDPASYVLPDVVCDFTQVRIEDVGADRVRVSQARGRAPTAHYKVSATYADGFRCQSTLSIVGFDAVAKARRTGEAILERTRAMFAAQGLQDYSAVALNVIGTEELYGPHAQALPLREATMRLAVRHPQKAALEIFAREIAPAGTSWAPGTTGSLAGGRPGVSPAIRLFTFLIPKEQVSPGVTLDGAALAVPAAPAAAPTDAPARGAAIAAAADSGEEAQVSVPLVRLAYARSGDKGDISNIGIIARHPELLPYVAREVTAERLRAYLAHLVQGEVTRYEVPGIGGFNFVLQNALDGGGMASLRTDPLGKSMGQIALSMMVNVPERLLALGR
ncbi:DUF1446 domain-containing protein [Verticiella sediminum]|uniref:DUF1446 domain-containing protein n=1 Tax=Verticiella sediminum TaxID=1247510 RepID=A0A556ABA6_9BURK|nr:acyclic terpene utilization AtuA family protein [Verticiella sediminum]TSH90153.1 DUF1446 domain-containing protein [Verticiella sediminum]